MAALKAKKKVTEKEDAEIFKLLDAKHEWMLQYYEYRINTESECKNADQCMYPTDMNHQVYIKELEKYGYEHGQIFDYQLSHCVESRELQYSQTSGNVHCYAHICCTIRKPPKDQIVIKLCISRGHTAVSTTAGNNINNVCHKYIRSFWSKYNWKKDVNTKGKLTVSKVNKVLKEQNDQKAYSLVCQCREDDDNDCFSIVNNV